MIKEVDVNGDGKIDYREFTMMLKRLAQIRVQEHERERKLKITPH